jgi:hypothetical protein
MFGLKLLNYRVLARAAGQRVGTRIVAPGIPIRVHPTGATAAQVMTWGPASPEAAAHSRCSELLTSPQR